MMEGGWGDSKWWRRKGVIGTDGWWKEGGGRSLQCPPNSCRHLVIPVESGGFQRNELWQEGLLFCHSSAWSFQNWDWNVLQNSQEWNATESSCLFVQHIFVDHMWHVTTITTTSTTTTTTTRTPEYILRCRIPKCPKTANFYPVGFAKFLSGYWIWPSKMSISIQFGIRPINNKNRYFSENWHKKSEFWLGGPF